MKSLKSRGNANRRLYLALAGMCFIAAAALFFRVKANPPFPLMLPHDLTDAEAAEYDRQQTISEIACGACPVSVFAGIVLLIYSIPDSPD